MIHFYKPQMEDLWFRQEMLSDAETMEFLCGHFAGMRNDGALSISVSGRRSHDSALQSHAKNPSDFSEGF